MTNPMRVLGTMLAAVILVSGTASGLAAQAAQRPAPPPVIPVKVDVVISKYQGDRKTASFPYSLMVNANSNRPTSLRMGVDVPVGMTTVTREGVTTTQPNYRNIGTSIDCSGESSDGAVFRVYVNVVDSSIVGTEPGTAGLVHRPDPFAIKTFTASNNLTLHDGQTTQFIAATDKITGEVVKIDVTLRVIK